MTTMADSDPLAPESSTTTNRPVPDCCYPRVNHNGSTSPTCRRIVVWRLTGLGLMCHYHFERFVTTHDVDFAKVSRLSDNDRDYVAHDGKMSGTNQWKRRYNEEAAG